jgi:eukaryotic-like serine/threonine-protein kinase
LDLVTAQKPPDLTDELEESEGQNVGGSTGDRNPFELLAEEFAERLRRGEHPSLNDYIERHPEHADDIRELFPALVLVEQNKPARQELNRSLAAAVPAARGSLPVQLGDYRILRYLGEGGMGVVYEAVRESLRSHVALKVMHPQYRNRPNYLRRFHTEARSAARLHHTNIVSVFDYGEHDGICYYAMQFIAGQSLDKVLNDIRQLRREKEGLRNGDLDTLPLRALSRGDQDDVAGGNRAQVTTKSLGETVALGLFTGRFATPGVDLNPGEQTTMPQSDETIAPATEAADLGTATRAFVSELRHAGETMRAAEEAPGTSGTAQEAESKSAHDTTSSLTGKADIRYYREVARLGAQVADALAYAHQRGVLHRDIKPPNLILDPLGNIWVTDFGLAKFEEGDDLSQSQDLVGTLRYMAPERFRGVSDRRGDVYALGATLYELLAFRQLFEGKDQLELIHRIENDPPVPLRQIDRRIPRDLETIVLKTLAKDPNHRFSSALELAEELRRFVEYRPIRSRPIPYYQQFGRWCKRNPWLAAANVTAATLTTVLAVVSTVAAFIYRDRSAQAVRDNVRIERAQSETREQLFKALYTQARAGRFSHQMGQRFGGLDALAQAAGIARDLKLPRERLEPLRDEAIACMALPDLKATGQVIALPQGVFRFAFDSAMTRYALRFRDGTIQVCHVADDRPIARFNARGDREIETFSFSPDGRYLATMHYPDCGLTVWDVDREAVLFDEKGPFLWWNSAKFSPDSRRVACSQEGALLVFDLATGHRRQRWPVLKPGNLAFRADGAQIAVTSTENGKVACRILDAESGRLVRSFPVVAGGQMDWSPDGSTLAIESDKKIYVWEIGTGTRRATLEFPNEAGLTVAFHPSGTLLASNGHDVTLRLWDPILGRPALRLAGANCNGFSRDGRIVVWRDDQLTTYQVDPALEYRTLAHAASQPIGYTRASIRHDGRILAVGTELGVVLWDLARGRELGVLGIGDARHSLFEESGDLLTTGSLGVSRWPVQVDQDRGVVHLGPPSRLALPPGDCQIAEDRQGRIVAEAHYGHADILTPHRKLMVGRLDDVRYVAVSPNGEWLATCTHSGRGVQLWRTADGTEEFRLPIDRGGTVRFSPDGQWLLTSASPCRLWAVGTWREARQVGGSGLCFSADGRLMAVLDASKIIRLVETASGRDIARLESPDLCRLADATFSPDGSRLVVTTPDGPAVHVWDLRAIRRKLAAMGLDWDTPAYPKTEPPTGSALSAPLKLIVDMGVFSGRLVSVVDLSSVLAEAREFEHAGNILEAIRVLRQAAQKWPHDAAAHNDLAWLLVKAPEPLRSATEALEHARQAVRLAPGQQMSLNTLGVALYRAAEFTESIATLEKSLAAGKGQLDAFDLLFLAMAHHRLGHRAEGRGCFDRAVRWMGEQKNLSAEYANELAAFRAEAEAVLAGPSD